MKLLDEPTGECGDLGSITHILSGCTIRYTQNFHLYVQRAAEMWKNEWANFNTPQAQKLERKSHRIDKSVFKHKQN